MMVFYFLLFISLNIVVGRICFFFFKDISVYFEYSSQKLVVYSWWDGVWVGKGQGFLVFLRILDSIR